MHKMVSGCLNFTFKLGPLENFQRNENGTVASWNTVSTQCCLRAFSEGMWIISECHDPTRIGDKPKCNGLLCFTPLGACGWVRREWHGKRARPWPEGRPRQ